MGDEATGLLGVWLLRSAYIERVDNRERSLLFGDDPRGVLILHEGGRMAAILTPSHQPGDPPPPLRKLLAYSGRYRIEPPNRFVTDVVEAFPGEIEGVSVHKPSLEDVFIRRTGHRFWTENDSEANE